jgi:hypothetical protein
MSAKSKWTDGSQKKPKFKLLRGENHPECV